MIDHHFGRARLRILSGVKKRSAGRLGNNLRYRGRHAHQENDNAIVVGRCPLAARRIAAVLTARNIETVNYVTRRP
jgi:hypothetical protein